MWKSILFAVVSCLSACSQAPESAPKPAPDAAGVAGLGIPNAVPVDAHLVSAGQPSPEQLAALASRGFLRVIQLRPATETGSGWEEQRAAELGLAFVRLPIRGNEDLTEANARALDRALAEAGTAGVLLTCASGNRCGGLLALRAFYCQGTSAEEALLLGKRAGMTRTEPAVRAALGLPPQ